MWGDLGFMFGGCICESLRRQVLLCESGVMVMVQGYMCVMHIHIT